MYSSQAISRVAFHTIHFLIVLSIIGALGLAWHIRHFAQASDRAALWNLHVSLGLTSLALVAAALLVMILDPLSRRHPEARGRGSPYAVYLLLYLSVILLVASGLFEALPGNAGIRFFGLPLPLPSPGEIVPAGIARAVHGLSAYLVIGLVVLQIGTSGRGGLERRGREPPLPIEPPLPTPQEIVPLQPASAEVTRKLAQGLASNLRVFGWIDFWAQFVLGLIIALLLAFAYSGKMFSPSKTGFGDAIYWGLVGFVLLCPSIVLAVVYARASAKVVASPANFLHHERRIAFWFLWTGLTISQLGIFVSFVGVAMSIALLIVKTISQPPGIAITDPNNIIRALDVFVLIVNFMLLIAHFIGVVTALWLGFCAAKARVEYISSRRRPAEVSG